MEQRIIRMSKRKAGGTAGANSVKYAVNLPTTWVKTLCDMGNEVELTFDGEQITIKKAASIETVQTFLKKARDAGHQLAVYQYMNGDVHCSTLYLDYTAQQLCVANENVPLLDTAFGVNKTPTWQDLTEFFSSRCIPETRVGLEHYLKSLGVEEYDPFMLIEKTQGRMAEDNRWLKRV